MLYPNTFLSIQEDDVRKPYIVRDRHCNCASLFIRPQYADSLCSEPPPPPSPREEGALLRIFGGAVPPRPPKPDSISDKKMSFFKIHFQT